MSCSECVKQRYYSLDVARGFSALMVVVFHFQHFYMFGNNSVVVENMPFYAALQPIYQGGWMAVDIFFCISGYVFFWLYSSAIEQKQISGFKFFWLRFSRLYPLHLATILMVAALQYIFIKKNASYFVYNINDGYHFFLSLFFLQGSGLEIEKSFNGPNWSISVEAIMYVAFYLLARRGLQRKISVLLFCVFVGLIVQLLNRQVGRGIDGFFLGGLVYYIKIYLDKNQHSLRKEGVFFATTVMGWFLTLLIVYTDPFGDMGLSDKTTFIFQKICTRAFLCLLVPLTILSLVMLEDKWASFFEKMSWLGDISYSSYLLHFPLQMVVALAVSYGFIGAEKVQTPLAIIVFLAVLVPFSLASYLCFERPVQGWLRRWIVK